MKQIVKITQQGEQYIQEPVELSKRETEILQAYIQIRDKFFELQWCQEQCDDCCSEVRSELNTLYQEFVSEYGPLGKSRNRNIIDKDPYGFIVGASVEVKMGHNEFIPADILTRNPNGTVDVLKTEDVREALGYILGMHGRVDMEVLS